MLELQLQLKEGYCICHALQEAELYRTGRLPLRRKGLACQGLSQQLLIFLQLPTLQSRQRPCPRGTQSPFAACLAPYLVQNALTLSLFADLESFGTVHHHGTHFWSTVQARREYPSNNAVLGLGVLIHHMSAKRSCFSNPDAKLHLDRGPIEQENQQTIWK
jgi:hypothetical protein